MRSSASLWSEFSIFFTAVVSLKFKNHKGYRSIGQRIRSLSNETIVLMVLKFFRCDRREKYWELGSQGVRTSHACTWGLSLYIFFKYLSDYWCWYTFYRLPPPSPQHCIRGVMFYIEKLTIDFKKWFSVWVADSRRPHEDCECTRPAGAVDF